MKSTTRLRHFWFGLLLNVIQFVIVLPLSIIFLRLSGFGKGSVIFTLFIIFFSLAFIIRFKDYKRSFIGVYSFLNGFGAIIILFLSKGPFSILANLLHFLVLVSSFFLSLLYSFFYIQRKETKSKLLFSTEKPRTIKEIVKPLKIHGSEIIKMFKERKNKKFWVAIFDYFSSENDLEHDSIIFTLGEEVDYNSSTFRKEKT